MIFNSKQQVMVSRPNEDNNFYPYVNFDNASMANKFEDMYVCVTFIHMLMSRELMRR